MIRAAFLAALLGPMLAGPSPARAKDSQALFDQTIGTRSVPAQAGFGGHDALRCSYFQDLTLREVGIDSPAPEAAAIIPGPPPSECPAKPMPGQITLKTENFSFLGRKGPFLLFSATDPNGAVPFKVLDAATGRVIYTDGMAAGQGFRSVQAESGALRLIYTRGFNAPCSLLRDAAGCWAKLVAQGQIPKALATAPPAAGACAASYRAGKATADDPSAVSYDVDMTLDTAGRPHIASRGTIHCDPMP